MDAVAAVNGAVEELRNQVTALAAGAQAQEAQVTQRILGQETLTSSMTRDFQAALQAMEAKVAERIKSLEEKMTDAVMGMRGPRSRAPDFDDRKLKLRAYGGDTALWRDFEYTLTGFVGRESQPLKEAMIKSVQLESAC